MKKRTMLILTVLATAMVMAGCGGMRNTALDVKDSVSEQDGGIISESEAIAIALAEVPEATEEHVWIKYEIDDGRKEYEGSVRSGLKEYDFEIDAMSGDIISWEVDD